MVEKKKIEHTYQMKDMLTGAVIKTKYYDLNWNLIKEE